MTRRFLDFLGILSLLLCAAVAVLWVRSHGGAETFWFFGQNGRGTFLTADVGRFWFFRVTYARPVPDRPRFGRQGGGAHDPPRIGTVMVRSRGPFSFAEVVPRTPTTAEEVKEAWEALREWREVEGRPPPRDRRELARRSRLRQRAALAPDVLLPIGGWGVAFPAWLPLAITLALPAARLLPLWRRVKQSRLAAAGSCPA